MKRKIEKAKPLWVFITRSIFARIVEILLWFFTGYSVVPGLNEVMSRLYRFEGIDSPHAA
jgi:hypothetical protein